MSNIRFMLLLSVVVSIFMAHLGFAEGYDKGTMFSGRYSGVASAVTGNAAGAEALYFNPAGLANGSGTEISANFSPTFSQFQGVVVQGGPELKSKTDMAPIFGLFASHQLTDALGIGLGIYAAGGTAAQYENVSLTPFNAAFTAFTPTVKSSLSLIEFSPGVGYELCPNLRVGFAWRVVAAKGEFSSVNYQGGAAIATQVKDLNQTRYNGFRVGAQWTTDDNHTGIGASWRTSMKFDLKGTSSVQYVSLLAPTTTLDGTGSATTVSTSFPSQIDVGGFHDVDSINTRFLLGYSWTNYSVNRELEIAGNVTVGTTTSATPNVPFNWRNQHLIKVGAETADWQDWQLRGGFGYVTQVVPNDRAGATLVAPGGGFSVHAGAGKYFSDKTIELNASLEYDLVSGTGSSPVPTNAASGNYKTSVYAVHTGLTFHL